MSIQLRARGAAVTRAPRRRLELASSKALVRKGGLALGLAIGSALGLTACQSADLGEQHDVDRTSSPSEGSFRPVNTGRQGPLTANAGPGAFAVFKPAKAPERWFATFENLVLCSTEEVEVTLDGVRVDESIEAPPVTVTPMLRTFELSDLDGASPALMDDYLPYFGALSGKPPFNQTYAGDLGGAGDYTRDIAGAKVLQTCAESSAAQGALATGSVPQAPFVELVFVVETDSDGAILNKAWLDYTADGEPRTLLIKRKMVMCGSAVARFCK